MFRPLLLATLLVALAYAAPSSRDWDGDEPDFCHDLDCPKYTLASKKDGYEVRKYESSRWVGVTMTSNDWYGSVNEAFEMLFNYISGQNDKQTKIPMASPVATKIEPGQNGQPSNYTILFFTPFEFKEDTPKPTNPKLAIVDLPAITAYVISFEGFERDTQLLEYAEKLRSDLERDNEDYVKGAFFTAGYDPPYRFIGRHNEVWYLAA